MILAVSQFTNTKRGRVVARVVPAGDTDQGPWQMLRGTARWKGDPLAPAIKESKVEALKAHDRRITKSRLVTRRARKRKAT